MAAYATTLEEVLALRSEVSQMLDRLHRKENEIAMMMADNIRLRRSEVSIDLMRRVWANLYFNEEEAGGTFQQTLSEVVDWLAARNALPDLKAWSASSPPTDGLCPYDIGPEGCHLESEEIGPCLCVNQVRSALSSQTCATTPSNGADHG
jgi:hypothetical protein